MADEENIEIEEINPAAEAIDAILAAAAANDASAFWRVFKEHHDALKAFREAEPVEYEAVRAEIKRLDKKINVLAMDKLLRDPADEEDATASEALVELAQKHIAELWHDTEGDGFATIKRAEHVEHWKIDSTGFREWLAWLAHTEASMAPASEVLKATSNALNGSARFDGEEYEPCRRAGKDDTGYWIDMGDDAWRAIRITSTGWQVIDNPPIRFLRNKSTRPLPTPKPGGELSRLWGIINVEEQERLLILAWVLECFRADTPYALLELHGEQGSAKSSTQTALRQFIDPSKVNLRGRPKTVEDIFVAAASSHVISYENLSSLSTEQSDALCTVCTGGGYAARKLYTNGEESTLTAHNPVVLNGISPVVLRPDLLDRSISVTLPIIQHRRTESELAKAIEAASPDIMGGLLDLLVLALGILPTLDYPADRLPRMADFASLGEAVARALNHPDDTFLELYQEHRKEAIGRTLDASPVATAMIAYINRGNVYYGTVGGLLEILNDNRPEHEATDYWPRSARGLGDAMRRYAPALRQLGIAARVETKARKDGIHCELKRSSSSEVVSGNTRSQRSQHSPDDEIVDEVAL